MKNDYYSFPDIDEDKPEDVFSFGEEKDGASSSGEKPFKVTLDSDDSFRVTRRPTSRPVSAESRTPQPRPINRTPVGRRMSDIPSSSEQRRPERESALSGREGASTVPPQRRPPFQRTEEKMRQERPAVQRAVPQSRSVSPVSQRSESQRPQRPQSISSGKKKKSGKKIFLSVVALLLALVLLVGGYGFYLLGKINYDDSTKGKNEYIASSELVHSASVKNILIIGSDARGDVSGMRSDTMILASIDKKNRQLKLTSFLRDSLVYIPAKQSWNKLNAAFSFGGAKMVIDTLEYNFKVRIDNYVIIDFEIFTEFINALGGVDVDGITEAEVNWLKRNVPGINIHPGKSHLTGGAALWYCRVRKIDSDFKRTERQRKVVGAVIDQVKHTNPLTTIGALRKVLPMITTDIEKLPLMGLGAGAVLSYMGYDRFQAQVPASGTWVDKNYSIGAVLEMNIDKNAELLKDFIFSKQEAAKE